MVGIGATTAGLPDLPKASGEPVPVVTLEPWRPQPFADLVLHQPELAGTLLLNPGWWADARVPASLPAEAAVSRSLQQQLLGVLPAEALNRLRLVVAETPGEVPAVFARADLVLVLAPARLLDNPEELARLVAPVIAAGAWMPAPPEEGVSEPLLAAAEALVAGGLLTLAALPPSLRPVSTWVDRREAGASLGRFFADVVDEERAWSSRRAALIRFLQPGGAPRDVGSAAALLVEAFNQPDLARRAPLEVLRFWRNSRHKDLPPVPGPVRRLLGDPAHVGIPRKSDRAADLRLLSVHALDRTLESGAALGKPPLEVDVPVELRLMAAAKGRASGSHHVCDWLEGVPVPSGVRTGCPEEEPDGGVVYVRARRSGGTEVVSRAAGGAEALLVIWPRWALFPVVADERHSLILVDPLGLWEIALDGGAQPRLLLEGTFRHVAISPSGRRVATVDWPDGAIVIADDDGDHRLAVRARAGLVWLEEDVLLVVDEGTLSLVSREGDVRPFPVEAPCARFVAARGETVVVSAGDPCPGALLRISLSGAAVTATLPVPGGPAGAAPLPDGSVIFSAVDGLVRWPGGERVERLAAGLTPGPG